MSHIIIMLLTQRQHIKSMPILTAPKVSCLRAITNWSTVDISTLHDRSIPSPLSGQLILVPAKQEEMNSSFPTIVINDGVKQYILIWFMFLNNPSTYYSTCQAPSFFLDRNLVPLITASNFLSLLASSSIDNKSSKTLSTFTKKIIMMIRKNPKKLIHNEDKTKNISSCITKIREGLKEKHNR